MPVILKPELPRTVACSVAAAILRRALTNTDMTMAGEKCSNAIAFAADIVDKCSNGYWTAPEAVNQIQFQADTLPMDHGSHQVTGTRRALHAIELILCEST